MNKQELFRCAISIDTIAGFTEKQREQTSLVTWVDNHGLLHSVLCFDDRTLLEELITFSSEQQNEQSTEVHIFDFEAGTLYEYTLEDVKEFLTIEYFEHNRGFIE